MDTVRVEVEIKGTTPLLQHRFGEQAEGDLAKGTRRVQVNRGTPREEAEKVCYRDKAGLLYHPADSITRLLREVGSGHKQKGSRKSMKYVIPAAVRMAEETMPLYNGDGTRLREFEVDSRPVTIPATKGRVMRHRPRLDCWSARFAIKVNADLIKVDDLAGMLTEGGEQVGIGDYRPEKGGPFGCFIVTRWEPQKKEAVQ